MQTRLRPPWKKNGIFRKRGIMKKLIILIIAAACAYGVLRYHFILMDRSVKILKKSELTLDDTFIDARGSNKSNFFLIPPC